MSHIAHHEAIDGDFDPLAWLLAFLGFALEATDKAQAMKQDAAGKITAPPPAAPTGT